jgi:hypothetical protein
MKTNAIASGFRAVVVLAAVGSSPMVWAQQPAAEAQGQGALPRGTRAEEAGQRVQTQVMFLELQKRQLKEWEAQQVRLIEQQTADQIEQVKTAAARQIQELQRQANTQIEQGRSQVKWQSELVDTQISVILGSQVGGRAMAPVRRTEEPGGAPGRPGVIRGAFVEDRLEKLLDRLDHLEKRLDQMEKRK